MEAHQVERKLTTILHADVQGYSRLIGEDDAATLRVLTPLLAAGRVPFLARLASEGASGPLRSASTFLT